VDPRNTHSIALTKTACGAWTGGLDAANDLVTGYDGQAWRKPTLDLVKLGVADAAGLDAHENLADAGRWHWPVHDEETSILDRTGCVEHQRSHRFLRNTPLRTSPPLRTQ
jgi:hypothetical protein